MKTVPTTGKRAKRRLHKIVFVGDATVAVAACGCRGELKQKSRGFADVKITPCKALRKRG